MSSRALRRQLELAEREKEKEGNDSNDHGDKKEDDDDEEDEESAQSGDDLSSSIFTRRGQGNAFAVLRNQSPSESEVKEDDDKETAVSNNDNEEIAKKRKKKKKKRVAKHNKLSSEDNAETESEVPPQVEAETRKAHSQEAAKSNLLRVEPKHLNFENEMKKIFGSRVVQSERDFTHRKGKLGRFGRNGYLVTPRQNWPLLGISFRRDSGLSMNHLLTKNNTQYFSFEHSSRYQEVQVAFFQAVESMNPNNIVSILNQYPFHLDSLIQLADVSRMGEDLQMASELIERAIYAMETAFHPLFSLWSGNSRLEYRRQENRSFHLALYRHMMYVGQKACYRTSLEICKLLLSLDPTADPLAVILALDFYALKSGQFRWFIRFYNELDEMRNLHQLPNFAFSLALAHYKLSCELAGLVDRDPSRAAAREEESEEHKLKANELLTDALLMFPSVLMPLLEKCSIQCDSRASQHKFFNSDDSLPQGLKMLVQLYVNRCYHVWKEPEVLPWLEASVSGVLDLVDASDARVDDYAQKRKRRFQGQIPRNIFRHIIVSDMKDSSVTLPPELANMPILAFDPLPPSDSVCGYTIPHQPTSPGAQNAVRGGLFSTFFRSFLPTYGANQQGQHAQIPPELEDLGAVGMNDAAMNNEEAQGMAADLRVSLTSLLDALRDLLTNINVPEVPNVNDADDDETEEDYREH